MPINRLYFTNVGPFSEIELDFDDQVNVLTGENNSGKSTILWVLAELLVYPFTLPRKSFRSDDRDWQIQYSWDSRSKCLGGKLPAQVDELADAYDVLGFTAFVPAQRHNTGFRSPGPQLSQDLDSRLEDEIRMWGQSRPEFLEEQSLEAIRQANRSARARETPELLRRRNLMLTGASLISDRAVIQKIIDLDYAAYRHQKPAMRSIIRKVACLASEIMEGFEVGFSAVEEDEFGLYPEISTPHGKLPLDVLSQGTQSTLHWLAHFLFNYAEYYDFPEDLKDKPGILIVDEIDAHLHPSWQRRIIPTLTKHFPSLQIFCSTHSPLMLAGLRAGQVQLLDLHDDATITVSINESDVLGWTADEILRTLLDIYSPTDLRTSESIRRLEDLDIKEDLSPSEAEELDELHRIISKSLTSGPTSVQVLEFANELRRARDELIHPSGPTSTQEQGTQEGPK